MQKYLYFLESIKTEHNFSDVDAIAEGFISIFENTKEDFGPQALNSAPIQQAKGKEQYKKTGVYPKYGEVTKGGGVTAGENFGQSKGGSAPSGGGVGAGAGGVGTAGAGI